MVRTKIGPGPGKYKLPPLVGYREHAITRYRNPEYTMRPKLPIIQKLIGPGPKYQIERMTSYGQDLHPAYSLRSRPKILKPFETPSPVAYKPELAPLMKEPRPPAFSMADRYKPFKIPDYPGPDRYEVPTTIGPKVPDKLAANAYTMRAKHDLPTKEKSPGPARYDPISTNRYKNRPPNYSMSLKTQGVAAKYLSPGPGAYYPQPKGKGGYSFGLKIDTDPYIVPDDDMPCVNK